MEITKRLLKMKSGILRKIEEAAHEGESESILIATQELKKIEDLIYRSENLQKEVKEVELARSNGIGNKSTISFKNNDLKDSQISARKRGKLRRNEFLESLEEAGIVLKKIKGSLFKSQSGKTVGVAYASERQDDRWFLGLPANKFDCAVLLCESNSGIVKPIFLPENFFINYGSSLSETNGQIKFNVSRKENKYFMVVPDEGNIDTSKYSNSLNSLG